MNSKFSFYQFSQTPDMDCDLSLPVCLSSDIGFFVTESISSVSYCHADKTFIGVAANVVSVGNRYLALTDDLDGVLYKGDCFRLRLTIVGNDTDMYYSNLLKYMGDDTTETSVLAYKCYESEFDFLYGAAPGYYNNVRLPIRIFNPQFPQADKVYVKSNGERSVQFSKIDKEWKLETEYLTAELHEKIIVALAHDRVLIDGESVTKSAEYEINWDEYVEYDCTGRMSKASCKVQQNRTLRNSNCR